MWICRLWCDFEEILTDSIFFYAGKRGEVVGGVGGNQLSIITIISYNDTNKEFSKQVHKKYINM